MSQAPGSDSYLEGERSRRKVQEERPGARNIVPNEENEQSSRQSASRPVAQYTSFSRGREDREGSAHGVESFVDEISDSESQEGESSAPPLQVFSQVGGETVAHQSRPKASKKPTAGGLKSTEEGSAPSKINAQNIIWLIQGLIFLGIQGLGVYLGVLEIQLIISALSSVAMPYGLAVFIGILPILTTASLLLLCLGFLYQAVKEANQKECSLVDLLTKKYRPVFDKLFNDQEKLQSFALTALLVFLAIMAAVPLGIYLAVVIIPHLITAIAATGVPQGFAVLMGIFASFSLIFSVGLLLCSPLIASHIYNDIKDSLEKIIGKAPAANNILKSDVAQIMVQDHGIARPEGAGEGVQEKPKKERQISALLPLFAALGSVAFGGYLSSLIFSPIVNALVGMVPGSMAGFVSVAICATLISILYLFCASTAHFVLENVKNFMDARKAQGEERLQQPFSGVPHHLLVNDSSSQVYQHGGRVHSSSIPATATPEQLVEGYSTVQIDDSAYRSRGLHVPSNNNNKGSASGSAVNASRNSQSKKPQDTDNIARVQEIDDEEGDSNERGINLNNILSLDSH